MRIQCYCCNFVYNRKKKPETFKCKVCGSQSYHYSVIDSLSAEDTRRNREIKKQYKAK